MNRIDRRFSVFEAEAERKRAEENRGGVKNENGGGDGFLPENLGREVELLGRREEAQRGEYTRLPPLSASSSLELDDAIIGAIDVEVAGDAAELPGEL
ncbi:hypothetical protein Droror1_Dr00006758 [Drosera rotundifolia]